MLTLALAPLVLAPLLTPALARQSAAARSAAQPAAAWWETFPEPSADLVVGAAGHNRLGDLVADYAELTGQHFALQSQTRVLLESSPTGLEQAITVPRAQVQALFESLLIEQDFVLRVVREAAPRLLTIESLRTQDRNTVRAHARFVPREHLAEMRDHPAMLVTTTLTLSYTDVRQLSNSMRMMTTDANTQTMLQAGHTDSIVLLGFGGYLADMVELLERIDAEAEAGWEERAKMQEAEQPEEDQQAADDE